MTIPAGLEFYFFHFMPFAHLPEDHKKYDSTWVDFSNQNYDPEIGQKFYTRYLREMVLAEELGFDAVCVNEHHSAPYSMMASPNLIAAALIPQTSRAKICVWGVPVALAPPNRIAEEYAMLDVMSGGRLEIAIPLGTGMEYWSNAVNPVTARARMRESIDIMLRAWTEDGPITYDGDFYNFRYLNVWPKPMQKPHPKIYMVGSGSPETIEFAAQHGFGFSSVGQSNKAQLKSFAALREQAQGYGHTITPDQLPIGVMAYVAETDEIAEREFMPHVRYFFEDLMRTTPHYLAPPGYISLETMRRRLGRPDTHGHFDYEAMTTNGRVIAGSPKTVADKIAGWLDEAQSSRVTCHLCLGDIPHWKAVKNMTMFAEEVMPRLRALSNAADQPAATVAV